MSTFYGVFPRIPILPVLLWACVLPAPAAVAWPFYSGDERFNVYIGYAKPLLWAFRESDDDDDEGTPFENEGRYRFDLKEIAEGRGFPAAVFASVNLFGIIEPRISFEWFRFRYDDYALDFTGNAERKDYALDILLGYDLNRIEPKSLAGCIYRIYPYGFAGIGYTDYTEDLMTGAGRRTGNVVLADVAHYNLGLGFSYGLLQLLNVGAEAGIKSRDFRTAAPPQPTGIAGEGFLRVHLAIGYGR